jgi:hypothetical protein
MNPMAPPMGQGSTQTKDKEKKKKPNNDGK